MALVGSTEDTKEALRHYEHPHKDEKRELIGAMGRHYK
jgi:hypothetical protein